MGRVWTVTCCALVVSNQCSASVHASFHHLSLPLTPHSTPDLYESHLRHTRLSGCVVSIRQRVLVITAQHVSQQCSRVHGFWSCGEPFVGGRDANDPCLVLRRSLVCVHVCMCVGGRILAVFVRVRACACVCACVCMCVLWQRPFVCHDEARLQL